MKAKNKTGPRPEVLVVDGNWKGAISKMLREGDKQKPLSEEQKKVRKKRKTDGA